MSLCPPPAWRGPLVTLLAEARMELEVCLARPQPLHHGAGGRAALELRDDDVISCHSLTLRSLGPSAPRPLRSLGPSALAGLSTRV